ncbi:hypothetical protein [Streptococcus fryi]
MTPIRIIVIFLFVFSVAKIILFYKYFKLFKPKPLSPRELQAFDKEDDEAFFEEDD